MRWLLPLFLACTPSADIDPGTDTDESFGDPDWSLVAGPFGDGVLLGAWSDGDTLLAVGGAMADDTATLVRYRDGQLCAEPSPADAVLWWIHGPREGEWYAVGERGTILHSVDGERVREDVPTEATLFGVYATQGEVWAVGGDVMEERGEIWRRRDGTWEPFDTDLPGVVFKVWRSWFVGAGIAYRLEDDALVAHPPPDGETLTTVRGRSEEDDVYAVGGIGVMVHWDGASWTRIETPFGQPLNGVWTAPDEDVWVSGAYGSQGRYDGSWTYPEWPVTGEHYHAVWPHQGEFLFLGGNLFSSSGHYAVVGRFGPAEALQEPTACASE